MPVRVALPLLLIVNIPLPVAISANDMVMAFNVTAPPFELILAVVFMSLLAVSVKLFVEVQFIELLTMILPASLPVAFVLTTTLLFPKAVFKALTDSTEFGFIELP